MTDRSQDPLDSALAGLDRPTPPPALREQILSAAPRPVSRWRKWRPAIVTGPAMAASMAIGVAVGYAQPVDMQVDETEAALIYAFEPSFDFGLESEGE